MTAAIAQVPVKTKPQAPVLKPAQYPTQEVPLYLIVRSETNIVRDVDDDFVEKIRAGVHTPVLIRPIAATLTHLEEYSASWGRIDKPPISIGQTIYKLVYGERRWIAAKRAGHTHIPATIRELTDTQALEIQVSENEDREDYKPMQRAAAYAHLRGQYMKDHAGEKGFTEEKCCDLIAQTCKNAKIKGRTVQQVIALTRLHKFCQDALNQGEMEASHAYEICRRSEEEQLKLLAWIRKETAHSQGDIPSVRRLKREIQQMDIEAEEKRRQQTLFKPPQPGTSTTPVPTVEDQLYAKAVSIVREEFKDSAGRMENLFLQLRLNLGRTPAGEAQAAALFARMEKEGIVGPEDKRGLREYIRPSRTPQTSADKLADKTAEAIKNFKPPTEAELKREAEAAARRDRENKRRQDAFEREERIKRVHRGLFFAALAKKARINSRLLSHVVPTMIFEVWENELPIEAFAQESLGWPAPKDGHAYAYEEVKRLSAKHARKFTGGLLAAMLLTLHLNDAESLKLAKYMGVDPKKLRKQAEASVKAEDAAAGKSAPKAKGQKPKAGARA